MTPQGRITRGGGRQERKYSPPRNKYSNPDLVRSQHLCLARHHRQMASASHQHQPQPHHRPSITSQNPVIRGVWRFHTRSTRLGPRRAFQRTPQAPYRQSCSWGEASHASIPSVLLLHLGPRSSPAPAQLPSPSFELPASPGTCLGIPADAGLFRSLTEMHRLFLLTVASLGTAVARAPSRSGCERTRSGRR